MIAMTQQAGTKLKSLRLELDPPMSQEDFSKEAGIRLQVYGKAERGGKITYTTAIAILKAMNILRAKQRLDTFEHVEDLELNIV